MVAPVVVVIGVLVVHAWMGAGYVLDDWYSVRGALFEGWTGVVDSELRAARPGALLAYALTFGLWPGAPEPSMAAQSLLFLGASVLLLLLLRRFLPPVIAAAIVVTWAVQPNQMSLETWPSATVATLGLGFLLGGALVVLRDPESWISAWGAALLLGASVLTYEATVVPAALAVVLLPWIATGRPHWRPIVAGAVVLGCSGLWILAHWHSAKAVQRDYGAYPQLLDAHFGWGVAPEGFVGSLLAATALAGIAVALARLALPSMRRSAGIPERLVLSGLVVMVSGSIVFVAYFYAPLGAGDRVSFVSSVGGAMVWVGLAWMVGRMWRPAGVAVMVVVLSLGLVVRWERTQLWATAKADAERIVEVVRSVDPSCATVTFGPAPIQEKNVAAFLDQSNVDAAVQVALGRDDVSGAITFDDEAFLAAPEECRIDIRPLSELEADVTVAPT